MGGCGSGGVCDHINHFGNQIKEIRMLKACMGGGPAMLKGPRENTGSIYHCSMYRFLGLRIIISMYMYLQNCPLRARDVTVFLWPLYTRMQSPDEHCHHRPVLSALPVKR